MKVTSRDLAQSSLFTLLTIVGAFISLPLGPVPLSLQSLFVVLSGLVLGPRQALMAQLAYLLLGLIGLPVFSGGSWGLGAVLRPSFGFIIGFVFASPLISQLKKTGLLGNNFILALLGHLLIYAFGLVYMYFFLNFYLGKTIGPGLILRSYFLVFIPGDLIKIGLASSLAKRLEKISYLEGGH